MREPGVSWMDQCGERAAGREPIRYWKPDTVCSFLNPFME